MLWKYNESWPFRHLHVRDLGTPWNTQDPIETRSDFNRIQFEYISTSKLYGRAYSIYLHREFSGRSNKVEEDPIAKRTPSCRPKKQKGVAGEGGGRGLRILLSELRSRNASWGWWGHEGHPGRRPATGWGPPRKSTSRIPTMGERLSQRQGAVPNSRNGAGKNGCVWLTSYTD